MDNQLLNAFRFTYHALSNRVHHLQQTRSSNINALRRTGDECFRLLASAEQVCIYANYHLAILTIGFIFKNIEEFPPDEYRILGESINTMIVALDEACHFASDLSDSALSVMEYCATGGAGRPRIEFDPTFLSFAVELRGPTDIANVFGCSARTVRRRALELNLLHPGRAPFSVAVGHGGATLRVHNGPQMHTRLSNISDDDLDAMISIILRDFPRFGRRMIDGRLRSQGIRVPRSRIRSSYVRIRGHIPSFVREPIARREYCVAGVNSLWHHDGQHGMKYCQCSPKVYISHPGLVKYKIYVHGFIDGKTRYVTGVRAHNNNQASTVVKLFHEARSVHGTPRRVRGDHGTENIEVAEWVDCNNGLGSYLWGPYVIAFQLFLPL